MADSVPILKTIWDLGSLPEGLSFDPDSAVLSGTPAATGLHDIEMTVRTRWGTAQSTLHISVLKNNGGYDIRQNGVAIDRVTPADLVKMVQDGTAQEKFNTVNTQLIIPWTNTSGKEYECPMNFCSFREVTLEDGSKKPGLILQSHYGLPTSDIYFDSAESRNPTARRSGGNNRWSYSNIRQEINGSGTDWYTAAHEYDALTGWTNRPGLLDCFPSAFRDILTPMKVQTHTEITVDEGVVDETYDLFFLPSLEEVYGTSETSDAIADSGVEGTAWEYWRNRIGGDDPQASGVENTNRIQYAIADHSAPCCVWLRSAYRSGPCGVWTISKTGALESRNAYFYYYNDGKPMWMLTAPACVVC